VKNKFIFLLSFLFLFTLFLVPNLTAEEQNISEFISQIQRSLKQKDIPAYLENFSSTIRDQEELDIEDKFNHFMMDSVSIFKASRLNRVGNEASIYLQALFQNTYSVVIETWNLKLLIEDDRWLIKEKKIAGGISALYKINMPSDRVERVKSIEVKHIDIKLSFKDAILFYDNIPGMETALVIIGKGYLHFSPSDPEERHQLELLYKKRFLEDKLTYAYLRFSNHFFQNNITIEKDPDEENFLPSRKNRNKAHSIFSKFYPQSFTVENSLNKELLSTLPQGDEAVFSFNGKKIGAFTYIYSPFTDEEINLFRWKDETIINYYSPLVDENKKKLFLSFVQMFEVKSYQIDIDFKPSKSYLSGKAKVEVESKVDSLNKLKFNLNPSLDILRIYDEGGRELFYSQDKLRESLYVYFVHPPPQKKSYSIEIYYRGKLEPPEQISDVVAGLQIHRWGGQFGQELDFLPPEYETYLFSRRAYWYPSPSYEDYFNARLKITIPSEYQCVSNGELIEHARLNNVKSVGENGKKGSSVYLFETKYPLKYISFIVGKFTKIGEDSGTLPIQHFYSSGVHFERKELLKEAKSIVRFYEKKFGPYPYEKLSIVRRLWPTRGGHSPASFIILNELPQAQDGSLLVNVGSPVDLSRWKEYFIAHEIAHQWWGQGVTWKTYHDQWLSEGLAQFASTLYLSEKHGDRISPIIFKKFSRWTEKKSKWGPITLGSRLSYFDPRAYQSIIYDKASLVLYMLKDYLGEEVFFRGLKEFFRRNKFSAAGTNDFIKTMEEISGKDLKIFFKNWLNSYVLPEVKVTHSLQKGEEGYILKLKITQQKERFVFPLWVEWIENGEKVKKMIVIDERNKEFEFGLQNKPKKIKINPDKAVPGRFF